MGRDIWLGGGNILLNVEPRRYVDHEVLPKQGKMAPLFCGENKLKRARSVSKISEVPCVGSQKRKKTKNGACSRGNLEFSGLFDGIPRNGASFYVFSFSFSKWGPRPRLCIFSGIPEYVFLFCFGNTCGATFIFYLSTIGIS